MKSIKNKYIGRYFPEWKLNNFFKMERKEKKL